jgi:hypothetical protein
VEEVSADVDGSPKADSEKILHSSIQALTPPVCKLSIRFHISI